jgi:hypothetical protein
MSKKSSGGGYHEELEDDNDLYTSESKTASYGTPRGMGQLDLSRVEYLDDENPNIQETPIDVWKETISILMFC